ncbi:MAG: hypothetical protein KME10_18755 [Plectolyngbya sp. WJT66-NPBG17]|nr:hypothetical protein [Plectolyngbya sp. WJT66-NPBG17]
MAILFHVSLTEVLAPIGNPGSPLNPPKWGTSSQEFRFKVPHFGGFRGAEVACNEAKNLIELTLFQL